MTQELARRQATANVRFYLARGEAHTMLPSPEVFSEQSGGMPFGDWLAALLNGPMPANQTCTHCLTPPSACTP